jgi:hypothetical protein
LPSKTQIVIALYSFVLCLVLGIRD